MKIRTLSLIACAALTLPLAALAADATDRDAILAGYARQAKAADPGFTAFSAQRGEALYRSQWTSGDVRTPSCASCHTDDPRQAGRNAKTGRPIDPAAVSTNPQRYTDVTQVDKHFARDCKSVIGRDCTPLERGDYITFLQGR
jgi:mono/diheme cytochrome c family protein